MTPQDRDSLEESIRDRLRAGDEAALDRLIRQHWRPLVFYLTQRIGDLEDAKDIAQRAFIRVWERRAELDPSGSLATYLYRIAKNLAVDEYRRSRVRDLRLTEQDQATQIHQSDPDDMLDSAQLYTAAQRALDALPERRREAFILVHLQGLSYRQAAEVMGNAPQTVANQVAAALVDLRELLKTYVEDPADLPAPPVSPSEGAL